MTLASIVSGAYAFTDTTGMQGFINKVIQTDNSGLLSGASVFSIPAADGQSINIGVVIW